MPIVNEFKYFKPNRRFSTYYFACIWFLYLIFSPIYIFPKGLPQPADMLLVLGIAPGIAFAFLSSNCRVPLVYVAGGLFAALTFLINWVNYAFFHDMRLVLSSLYYPYNFMVFLFVVYIFKENYSLMLKVSLAGILIAVVMQAGWAEFLPDPGMKRMTAGFKNPNQLAYWALLSAGMVFFLKRDTKFTITDFMILGLTIYIQTLALSKAGIIATTVFLIFTSFAPQMPQIGRYITSFSVLVCIAYLAFSPQTISNIQNDVEAFERVVARLETIGHENDDSPEGRGYNRIVNNPEYLIVGAGEGGFERFRTWASSNELHSGLATILFSYGIFGFMLFCVFMYFIFYRQPWYCWAILFSILLFSVSSQTIRFTHTWVFFAMAYATFVVKDLNFEEHMIVLNKRFAKHKNRDDFNLGAD